MFHFAAILVSESSTEANTTLERNWSSSLRTQVSLNLLLSCDLPVSDFSERSFDFDSRCMVPLQWFWFQLIGRSTNSDVTALSVGSVGERCVAIQGKSGRVASWVPCNQIDWFHTSILAALAFAIKAGIGPAIREMFTRQWRRHVVSAFCIYPSV